MKYNGYRRAAGISGIRNYVVIIPAINCLNDMAYQLAMTVPGSIPLCHNYVCAYEKRDRDKAVRVLSGIGENPNVYAALILGLGCEPVPAEEIACAASGFGKPILSLSVDKTGYDEVMNRGRAFLRGCLRNAAEMKRVPCDVSELILGIKCGGSGSLSLLSNNAAVGCAADILIEEGGSVIFSETAEILGMEKPLAERADDPSTAERLLNCTEELRAQIRHHGVDLLGSEPNKGNMESGLTTIEEKSLGAVAKAGSSSIADVLSFGDRVSKRGLLFMDCESAADPVYAGEAAAGAQISVLSLAGGMPARLRGVNSSCGSGLSTLPICKVLGSNACKTEEPYFDVCVGSIIDGSESIEAAGERIFKKLLDIASGEMTFTERFNKYWAPVSFYRSGLIV